MIKEIGLKQIGKNRIDVDMLCYEGKAKKDLVNNITRFHDYDNRKSTMKEAVGFKRNTNISLYQVKPNGLYAIVYINKSGKMVSEIKLDSVELYEVIFKAINEVSDISNIAVFDMEDALDYETFKQDIIEEVLNVRIGEKIIVNTDTYSTEFAGWYDALMDNIVEVKSIDLYNKLVYVDNCKYGIKLHNVIKLNYEFYKVDCMQDYKIRHTEFICKDEDCSIYRVFMDIKDKDYVVLAKSICQNNDYYNDGWYVEVNINPFTMDIIGKHELYYLDDMDSKSICFLEDMQSKERANEVISQLNKHVLTEIIQRKS